MKRIIIAVFVLSSIFSGWGYGQKNNTDTEPPEIRAEVEKLLTDIENVKDDPLELNTAIRKLKKTLNGYRIERINVEKNLLVEVTKKLVNIFNTISDEGTNEANKIRIIETIGRSDNSPEAHEFFLKILEHGPEKYRERALWSLSPNGVHGDDIYDKIKELMEKGIIDKVKFLYALKSANSQRALPEIQEFIKTTDDLKQFIKKGLLLCEYRDPDAIDVVIDRYDYFKSKPIPKEYAEEMYSADDAIMSDMLYKYIEAKEGLKLQKAMEICEDKSIFGDEDLPILEKKLKSKDIITRRAIIRFLGNKVNLHSTKIENVKKVLQEAESKETDKELKKELKSIIKNLGDK